MQISFLHVCFESVTSIPEELDATEQIFKRESIWGGFKVTVNAGICSFDVIKGGGKKSRFVGIEITTLFHLYGTNGKHPKLKRSCPLTEK